MLNISTSLDFCHFKHYHKSSILYYFLHVFKSILAPIQIAFNKFDIKLCIKCRRSSHTNKMKRSFVHSKHKRKLLHCTHKPVVHCLFLLLALALIAVWQPPTKDLSTLACSTQNLPHTLNHIFDTDQTEIVRQELKQALVSASPIRKGRYSAHTYNNYLDALSAAKQTLNSPDSTCNELISSTHQLNKAMDDLANIGFTPDTVGQILLTICLCSIIALLAITTLMLMLLKTKKQPCKNRVDF